MGSVCGSMVIIAPSSRPKPTRGHCRFGKTVWPVMTNPSAVCRRFAWRWCRPHQRTAETVSSRALSHSRLSAGLAD